jgi:ABC-type amino acid transport substrate-binding protein
MDIGQVALVRREDASKYLLGIPIRPEGTLGVMKGTTSDYVVQQQFPRSKRKQYKTSQDGAKALEKKKIDLLICDSPVAFWLAGMNEQEGLVVIPAFLTKEQLAWAVRKSDTELLKSVNDALDKFQKNGQASAIIKHWLPQYK